MINLPLADSEKVFINMAIIINDPSCNLIHTDVEPKKILVQTATSQSNIILPLDLDTTENENLRIDNSSSFKNAYNKKLKILCILIFFTYFSIICLSVIIVKYQN